MEGFFQISRLGQWRITQKERIRPRRSINRRSTRITHRWLQLRLLRLHHPNTPRSTIINQPIQVQTFLNRFFENEGDHRHELGHSKGGKVCGNKSQVEKIRSIGKEMIKLIGKKLISGDLNLTRISFPIKAMVPKTALENSTMASCTMPYFMKRAC